MGGCHTVLLTSDDPALIETTEAALGHANGYRLIRAHDERQATNLLADLDIDLLIADLQDMPDVADLLMASRTMYPSMPRLLLSQPSEAEQGIAIAHAAAAYLYLVKPVFPDQIRLVVKRALELAELSRRHRLLSRELKISMDDNLFGDHQELAVDGGVSRFEKLVYVSPPMADLVSEAKLAAQSDLPVLIHGETGTGKELLARAIHFNSDRMAQTIHVQNCGGIPDEVLHSELFGHVKGAFTGAISNRLGLFRAADGGTVFLDEISETSKNFQVSLLRLLQEGEVKPLGSDRIDHCNVRIVAASNRRLEELVERGLFRRDLYYRLKGFSLEIPPLRNRREDIPVLTDFFIEKYAGVVGRRVIGITKDALAKIRAHDYPGNVRELETEIRRMVAIAENGGYISERHLSPELMAAKTRPEAAPEVEVNGATLKELVERLEKQVVARSLERVRWNQSRAAEELGLSRVGLANKIKRYGLRSA